MKSNGKKTRRPLLKVFHQTLVPKGAGWPIKISYLYIATFCIVMPFLCFRLKNSPFNRFSKTYMEKSEILEENDKRLEAADNFFSSLEVGKRHDMFIPSSKTPGSHVDIQLVILTQSRNRIAKKLDNYEPKYLTQSLWRFSSLIMDAMSQGFQYSIKISACNVDTDPREYSEAISLRKYIHVYSRFNKTYNGDEHPKEKEKDDYIFCIKEVIKTKSKYVFLVEDDGYPTDDFMWVLQRTLDRFLERKLTRGEFYPRTEEVAFVKFYHAEWVMGFISLQRERLLELLALGMFFGTILTLLLEKYYFIIDGHLHSLWIIMILYSMLVFHFMGRVNLMEFHRLFSPHLYSYVPAPACCIPGVLYTADGAKHVIDYLAKIQCSDELPKDMALGKFVLDTGATAYQVQPNTFLHIGAYSLVREKFDSTRVDSAKIYYS